MKKIQLICMLVLFGSRLLLAQNWPVMSCITNQQNTASNNSSNSTTGGSCYGDDLELLSYIPNSTTPTLYFRLNFVILKNDAFKATAFTGISLAQLTQDAQLSVNNINSMYQAAGNIPATLPVLKPSPLVPDTKIQFVLNQVYTVTTTQAIITPFSIPNFKNIFPFDTANTLNIYFFTDTVLNGYSYVPFPLAGNAVHVVNDASPHIPGTEIMWTNLLWHELGHALGSLDDHYMIGPTNPPVSRGYNNANIFYNPGAYLPDDAAVDIIQASVCSQTLYPNNNNLMSNSGCRQHLSARQIASYHYLVAKNVTRKYTQYNTSFYTYAPCAGVNNSPTWPILIDQTWTTTQYSNPPGDIIVNAGKHLTISTCVYMKAGAKIIVEPGAKLSVINGAITSACIWKGIEVRGVGINQGVNASTGMPVLNGMIALNTATISNAEVGVTLAEMDQNNQPVYGTSGGIIQSNGSSYVNNTIAVKFHPFLSIGGPLPDNVSYFKQDRFIINNLYYGNTLPQAAVSINQSFLIDIIGCSFEDMSFMSAKAIHCTNGSFTMKDFCTASSNNYCTGTLIQNTIKGFKYGIYLSTAYINTPSFIDHLAIDQLYSVMSANTICKVAGGIYILNNFGSSIVNCKISVLKQSGANPPMNYCVYLDNCDGYVIENNTIEGFTTGDKVTGIYVNNSGTGANSIYNNSFNHLQQCLWAQNLNYDPATGTGLLMNCNDFLNSKYNIGVQEGAPLQTCLGPNCPPQPVQFAGVNKTQGVTYAGATGNVRNTYGTQGCNTNAENKYYVNTSYPFVITSHGSFVGSQFHPTPQTNNSCSNANEVVDIVGSNPLPTKSQYCPISYMPSFSNFVLNGNGTIQRGLIHSLGSQYLAALDGHNTTGLLSDISSYSAGSATLKNNLTTPAYLSDTVIKAYFAKSGVPHENLEEVFAKNAPLHPLVWQQVYSLGLNSEEQSRWDSLQYQNRLSDRADVESQLTRAHTELGLINNEKIRRFLAENTQAALDSVVSLYALNEMPGSKVKLAGAQLAAGKYTEAETQITALRNENAANKFICDLLKYSLDLKRDSNYIISMRANTGILNYLDTLANSRLAGIEGYAKALLELVYNHKNSEQLLEALEPEAAGRMAQQEEEANKAIQAVQLVKGVKIYPNPAGEQLNVEIQGEEDMTIKVCDLAGKVLISQLCRNICQIKTTALQNGVYMVTLYTQNTLLSTKKIVIIK